MLLFYVSLSDSSSQNAMLLNQDRTVIARYYHCIFDCVCFNPAIRISLVLLG